MYIGPQLRPQNPQGPIKSKKWVHAFHLSVVPISTQEVSRVQEFYRPCACIVRQAELREAASSHPGPRTCLMSSLGLLLSLWGPHIAVCRANIHWLACSLVEVCVCACVCWCVCVWELFVCVCMYVCNVCVCVWVYSKNFRDDQGEGIVMEGVW